MQTMQRTGAIEYKDIAASAMQVTSERQGIIEGLVSKTGNVDLQDDRVMYGAWRDTVKSAYARKAAGDPYLVPFLWSHNFEALPPGGVFHLDETREGLFAKVKMNLEIQSGAELWASYKAGTVSKQSIGYRTVTSDYEKIEGKTVRNLRRCDLLECSGVVFPANPLASITSVKRYWPGYSARQKGNAMSVSVKDFNGRYAAEQLDDWQWSDWSDLTSALKASIDDCFSGGGDPLATFETDVAPQLLAALRSYIAEGVSLGYTGGSGMDMGMMSMFGAGRESKAGYLNASDHVAIKESSAMIMKHAKIIQSASANVERANARARAGALAGWPVYGSMSEPSSYLTKEEEQDITAQLKLINSGLELDAVMREARQDLEDQDPLRAQVARVEEALQAFERKRR